LPALSPSKTMTSSWRSGTGGYISEPGRLVSDVRLETCVDRPDSLSPPNRAQHRTTRQNDGRCGRHMSTARHVWGRRRAVAETPGVRAGDRGRAGVSDQGLGCGPCRRSVGRGPWICWSRAIRRYTNTRSSASWLQVALQEHGVIDGVLGVEVGVQRRRLHADLRCQVAQVQGSQASARTNSHAASLSTGAFPWPRTCEATVVDREVQ
jgi:hypothetical protein